MQKKPYITNINQSIVLLALLLTISLFGGCSTQPQAVDPLTGWTVELLKQPDQAIVNDYQDYIQKLPPKVRFYVQSPFWYLKDATGQHAIKFEVPLHGQYYEHVLIYDRDDKRIKVVVYAGGRYES